MLNIKRPKIFEKVKSKQVTDPKNQVKNKSKPDQKKEEIFVLLELWLSTKKTTIHQAN